ncbi:MAG TPA: hypothetical protein VNA25_22210, partial [Phycisphaerae bacterium]|nr:hypothetical protein [Phycisphaerae bacterium]
MPPREDNSLEFGLGSPDPSPERPIPDLTGGPSDPNSLVPMPLPMPASPTPWDGEMTPWSMKGTYDAWLGEVVAVYGETADSETG